MMFRPKPDCAIGNLSICMATHYLNTGGRGTFHPDVYAHGRDRMFTFDRVSGEGVENDQSCINGFLHLRYPDIGAVMKLLIKPSPEMEEMIQGVTDTLEPCVAGFHIRRGTYAEDSERFAFFPTASDEAVDAMVKRALELDAPVLVISDSVSTREDFKRRVPKAVCLDLDIGFTACEHSQNCDDEVREEDVQLKMNSALEWFALSRMREIYTTMGGVCGRNVPEGTPEGISSSFGYSSALYGGVLPHYVYNDGTVYYPNTTERGWSDIETGKYILVRNPTKEKIAWAKKHHGMWRVLVYPSECEEAGIRKWCEDRMHVVFITGEPVSAKRVLELDDDLNLKDLSLVKK
jgi:hypothetical protein